MSSQNSVSAWIAALKAMDDEAAQRLWSRFSAQLVERARQRLEGLPKGVADEDDIAQSVFRSIWRGAVAGRLSDVKNRDDLWVLMLAVTKQKVVDYVRRETAQKRGGGRVRSETSLASEHQESGFALDWLMGEAPTPEYLIAFEEESGRLLRLLRDDSLRNVAMGRIEGYSVAEIATALAISTRSVERKLQLVRKAWAKELILGD
jgi:DNA-directed RNA polymerase specialized sigma24 family protein